MVDSSPLSVVENAAVQRDELAGINTAGQQLLARWRRLCIGERGVKLSGTGVRGCQRCRRRAGRVGLAHTYKRYKYFHAGVSLGERLRGATRAGETRGGCEFFWAVRARKHRASRLARAVCAQAFAVACSARCGSGAFRQHRRQSDAAIAHRCHRSAWILYRAIPLRGRWLRAAAASGALVRALYETLLANYCRLSRSRGQPWRPLAHASRLLISLR